MMDKKYNSGLTERELCRVYIDEYYCGEKADERI